MKQIYITAGRDVADHTRCEDAKRHSRKHAFSHGRETLSNKGLTNTYLIRRTLWQSNHRCMNLLVHGTHAQEEPAGTWEGPGGPQQKAPTYTRTYCTTHCNRRSSILNLARGTSSVVRATAHGVSTCSRALSYSRCSDSRLHCVLLACSAIAPLSPIHH